MPHACTQVDVGADVTAPELTDALFAHGSALLRSSLPALLSGQLPGTPQDDRQATYAHKVCAEAVLCACTHACVYVFAGRVQQRGSDRDQREVGQ